MGKRQDKGKQAPKKPSPVSSKTERTDRIVQVAEGDGRRSNGGARPGAGRKTRASEAEYLTEFGKAVTPKKFGQMTRLLVEMFYDTAEIRNKQGTFIRLAVDPATRARIWERLAAYNMGEPTKRVETGKFGEMAQLIAELMDETQTADDSQADSEAIQASWVQT